MSIIPFFAFCIIRDLSVDFVVQQGHCCCRDSSSFAREIRLLVSNVPKHKKNDIKKKDTKKNDTKKTKMFSFNP